MPAPDSPASLSASSARSPAGRSGMRISDAERAEIADELSRHYAEGRLDQDELRQRLDQAMAAKTYRDLSGLLQDLPQPDMPAAVHVVGPARRRRRAAPGLMVLALITILLIASVHAITWMFAPFLWSAVVCAIVVLAVHRR